jgi:hypothetical protein
MQVEKKAGINYSVRTIYLGRNVTDYPQPKASINMTVGLVVFK